MVYRIELEDMQGNLLDLDDLAVYEHEQSDGFAMPPIQRLWSSLPGMDGALHEGALLQPRRLTFRLLAKAYDPTGLCSLRDALIGAVRPRYDDRRAALKLWVTRPAGDRWYLQVHLEQALEAPWLGSGRRSANLVQSLRFTLVAPDPAWAGEALQQGVIPTTSIQAGEACTFVQAGSWADFPTLTLNGPLQHPVIVQEGTGAKIDLAYTIPAEGWVQVETRPGARAVTYAGGSRLDHLLSAGSSLDFALLPAPEAGREGNRVRVTAESVGLPGNVTLTWRTRRVGI